jgi:tartronate-semialdehyde synthase
MLNAGREAADRRRRRHHQRRRLRDLLVEFAELTGVPVIPTLMGWGAIPDDHPLMAGMVRAADQPPLRQRHDAGSDFVLGIGNRWANRHTGSIEVYTKGRKFVHVDIEPTQIGRVFGPTTASSPTPGGARAVRRGGARAQGRRQLKDRGDWAAAAPSASALMLRKTHFDQVPIKPQRVYQEMNEVFGRDTCYVTTIGLSQIAGAQFLHVYGRALDQLRPGRPARLDHAGGARRARRRPDARWWALSATTTSSS